MIKNDKNVFKIRKDIIKAFKKSKTEDDEQTEDDDEQIEDDDGQTEDDGEQAEDKNLPASVKTSEKIKDLEK